MMLNWQTDYAVPCASPIMWSNMNEISETGAKQLACATLLVACLFLTVSACKAGTVGDMNNACRAEIEGDNFDIAETLCKASLDAAEHVGTDGQGLALSIRNLADVFVEQDKPSEAEVLYQRALTIYSQIKHEDSLEAASVMEDLGNLYVDQKKLEQAEPYLRRAMEIRMRTQGSDAKETIEVRNEYELLLRKLRRKP